MIFKLKKINLLLSLVAVTVFWSCGNEADTDSAITTAQVSDSAGQASDPEQSKNLEKIFHAVPSPIHMAGIVKKSGVRYDADILNNINHVNEYVSAHQQALNLGIFGADLSYTSVFNQNQESIIYLSCAKKLADKLGVSKAFSDETIERMETNVENRDSLLQIVSDTYYNLDSYLKENGRNTVSAMVVAAGWIEGLYLATTVAEQSEDPDPELIQRIAEQKLSLNNLMALVNGYNKDGSLNAIVRDLKNIEAAYENVDIQHEKPTAMTNESANTTVITGLTAVDMAPEVLNQITSIVREIRSSYVKP